MRETSGEKILIFEGVVRKLSHAQIEVFKFFEYFLFIKIYENKKKFKYDFLSIVTFLMYKP
jgi:hypothetical protein